MKQIVKVVRFDDDTLSALQELKEWVDSIREEVESVAKFLDRIGGMLRTELVETTGIDDEGGIWQLIQDP